MKTFILALLPLVLTGCTITKQAQVSEASAITGVVRLTYNQAMLQTARTDDYVTQGTATKECQRLGYASAEAFGQPVSTCSVYAGSLCLNTKITLAWQCHGVAVSQSPHSIINISDQHIVAGLLPLYYLYPRLISLMRFIPIRIFNK